VTRKGATILLVDDDPDIRGVLRESLLSRGHSVLEAGRVAEGAQRFRENRPDLVVLDLSLPDGTGIELCRAIRAHAELAATPVIMLTGDAQFKTMQGKEAGFTAGADQYLLKPIKSQEFLLWVDALLRRQAFYAQNHDHVEAGKLVIDIRARLVRYGDQVIGSLTAREFDLLYYLVKNRPKIVSRETIMTQVWRTDAEKNVVDVHLSHLRGKLPPELAERIQNVSGQGYRFVDAGGT
jgi:two-component system, OmpR family, response regulator ArlR